jgi:hypothetical protein
MTMRATSSPDTLHRDTRRGPARHLTRTPVRAGTRTLALLLALGLALAAPAHAKRPDIPEDLAPHYKQ